MSPSSWLLLCAIFLARAANGASVFTFKGDPFKGAGRLNVSQLHLSKGLDGLPTHTHLVFPTSAGIYTPLIFIPGSFGAVRSESYSTVLTHLASYGYIIAGMDLVWPAEEKATWAKEEGTPRRLMEEVDGEGPKLGAEPQELFQIVNWLKNNFNQKVIPGSNVSNVSADWSKFGLMSHSFGADYLVKMLQQNHTFAKAAAFLEPGSLSFKAPLNYSIPALSYGTQFSTEFPPCCFKGFTYHHFYSELLCPRLLMNVTGYGHCSIVDEIEWDVCHYVGICKTVESNNRDLYREEFVPGVLAAFFGTYLQGNSDIIKYLTTPDDMPIPLGELKYDLNC